MKRPDIDPQRIFDISYLAALPYGEKPAWLRKREEWRRRQSQNRVYIGVIVMNKIIMIPVKEIYPHPNNPRKDLGDLSELAASIRESGVLQNLTVIEGHYLTEDEWNAEQEELMKMQLEEDPEAPCVARPYDPHEPSGDGYTTVIGHRRAAAAKLAGLTEIPAVVIEMDYKTQLATMMTENVQRADLTPFEQAKGFQLMMDLGMSVNEVSEKTGFSKDVVRRRLKIAGLDSDKLSKGAANYTLFDLERIAGIDDKKKREELMTKLGTDDFSFAIRNEESNQAAKRAERTVENIIKKAFPNAKKVNHWNMGSSPYNDYSVIVSTDPALSEAFKLPTFPEDKTITVYAIDVTHWYNGKKGYYIKAFFGDKKVKNTEKEKAAKLTPLQKENATIKKMRAAALKKARDEFYYRRCDFIRSLTENKIYNQANVLAMGAALSYNSLYDRQLKTLAYLLDDVKITTTNPNHKLWKELSVKVATPLKLTLCEIYSQFDPLAWGEVKIENGCAIYEKSIDIAYELLEALGYKKGADETAYYNGTSELFKLSHFRPIYRAEQAANAEPAEED